MIRVVTTRDELRAERAQLHGRVAVVMTMGALHEGHAELVRHAMKRADSVVVTIFVNPLQFGEAADLEKYPRQLAADVQLCEELGVQLVFAPTVDEIYPNGTPSVTVSGGWLTREYEGVDRPGHFDGMLTVVNKLLNLTTPDFAIFGEKDAQQLALARAMVRDLDLGVRIVGVPIVRELDGLAMSSRNTRLTDEQRIDALALSRALSAGFAARRDGPDAIVKAATTILATAAGVEVSYLVLLDDETWRPVTATTRKARLLVAARVGDVRLIDNEPIRLRNVAKV